MPDAEGRSSGTFSHANRRVAVTGGAGFLGQRVVAQLEEAGYSEVLVPRREDFDLTEQSDVRRFYREMRPDILIHLAAEVGGIGANRRSPGRFFYANAIMGILLIEEARRAGVEKFVQVGTICAYPKFTSVPFREEDLWDGYPEETNAPYGIAKKALLVQLQAYREEYGMQGIYLLPVNLYGPGDNFDPSTSHVIPALILKMFEAKEQHSPTVEIWGTGGASREFLYVDDCARGVVLASQRYESGDPVNLGTGREIKISELAALIAELVGYGGQLVYDPTKPDGQPRRSLDTRRAREQFGFEAEVSLRAGLERTIEWYEKQRANALEYFDSGTGT